MRIGEAARRLGTSARMLRYREALGLTPTGPARSTDRTLAATHRTYDESDVAAIGLGMELEHRYDVSPAALAFALRVLGDPGVAADVRLLGERLGRLRTPGELERERALRWLGRSGMAPEHPPTPRRPIPFPPGDGRTR